MPDPDHSTARPADAHAPERLSLRPDAGGARRFAAGDAGQVHQDGDLGRRVRIDLGNQDGKDLERFHLLAGLEHPNIPPLYDIDHDVSGNVVGICRVVEGRSLAQLFAAHEAPSALLEQLRIVSRICDAVAYAHERGILHGELCPDCIYLGAFGTVLVTGWGDGFNLLSANDAYLAPEIVRGSEPTIASEVFAVGATAFHLIIGRHPLWEGDEQRITSRRKAGDIDLPTSAERRVVDPALLAILLRALEEEPVVRQKSVLALAADLDRFITGLLTTAPAHVEPLPSPPRSPWQLVLVALAFIAAAVWWGRTEMAPRASWGRPLCDESFTKPEAWLERWRVVEGAFIVDEGRLVSSGDRGSFAYFSQRLEGGVAIEYQASMDPAEPPCDISVCYAVSDPLVDGAAAPRFLLQVGANDNSYAQILTPQGAVVSSNPLMLIPGKTYHIRMEIVDEALRILVDGVVICEHRELVPLTSGWLGLYAFYPGKIFDDVKIFAKGLPSLISPIAIGDQYSQDGDWNKAATAYERVATTHAGSDLGEEAAYRHGYAVLRQGRVNEAEIIWNSLQQTRWAGRIRMHALEARLVNRAYGDIAAGISQLWPSADEDLRQRLIALWTEAIHLAARPGMASLGELQALIALRDQHFPNLGAPGAAKATLASGDYAGVLQRFPEQVAIASTALRAEGRSEEVLTRYGDRRYQVAAALHDMGRLDELKAMQPPMPWFIDYASADLLKDLTDFNADSERLRCENPRLALLERAVIANRLGDDAWALRLCQSGKEIAGSSEIIAAYLLGGALEDLLARYPAWSTARFAAQFHERIEEFQAGAAVAPIDIAIEPGWYVEDQLWCAHLLIRPFVARLAGEAAAMDQALADIKRDHRWSFAQQPWYCANFLTGVIDAEAFLAQPRRGNAPALLAWCTGLAAELAGDVHAARSAYQAFVDMPAHHKPVHGQIRDPLLESFAAWRLQAVSGAIP